LSQDIVTIISLAISLALSLIAVSVSLYTFRIQKSESSYSDIDDAYCHILDIAISNPSLRNPRLTATYFTLPDDDEFRLRYEAYAFMCWNIVETIYDRQGDPKSRFGVSSTWLPVMIEENRLHLCWFSRNLRLFKQKFQRFVMSELNDLHVIEGTIANLDDVYPRMERDFPDAERKDRAQIEQLMAGGMYKLYLAKHSAYDAVVGYALLFVPKSPQYAWLDYMAIEPRYRNAGLGTLLFNKLCEDFKGREKGIMLEVEPATSADPETLQYQQRRIAFYRRLGAKQLDVPYLFPTNEDTYPMLLFFKPIAQINILPKAEIQGIIRAAYAYIHTDVANRDAILGRFIDQVHDNPL
jgi:ribosomal protein S18 acetylase RimI-like enzyme